MLALHAIAAGSAMASCCCLGLSARRRDRKAWAVSATMVAAMAAGLVLGSIGMIAGGIALVAAAPIAVTGHRSLRAQGLHRALGALSMGSLMIIGSGHSVPGHGTHQTGIALALIASTVGLGIAANIGAIVASAHKSAFATSLPMAGEALFMVAGVALTAAA